MNTSKCPNCGEYTMFMGILRDGESDAKIDIVACRKCRWQGYHARTNIFQPLVDLAKEYMGAIGNRPS